MAKTTNTTPKRQPNTTVAIDAETTARLNSFCSKLEITKKDFIMLALDFFEQTGLTPQDTDKVLSTRTIEKQMADLGNRLAAIDQRTEQSNTIISNVHGAVMGQMGISMQKILEQMILEHEAANQILLEAAEIKQQTEELQTKVQSKKKKWWKRT